MSVLGFNDYDMNVNAEFRYFNELHVYIEGASFRDAGRRWR